MDFKDQVVVTAAGQGIGPAGNRLTESKPNQLKA